MAKLKQSVHILVNLSKCLYEYTLKRIENISDLLVLTQREITELPAIQLKMPSVFNKMLAEVK